MWFDEKRPESIGAIVYCGDPARGGQEVGMSNAPIRVHDPTGHEPTDENGVVLMNGRLEFGPFHDFEDAVNVTHIQYIRHSTGERLGGAEEMRNFVVVEPGDSLIVRVPLIKSLGTK